LLKRLSVARLEFERLGVEFVLHPVWGEGTLSAR